jgi:hypothetical protein
VDRFDVPPDLYSNPKELPKDVRVTNWPKFGQDLYNNIRREYDALRRKAKVNQVAVMRYYSPAGEVIHVNQVSLYDKNSNSLLIYGDDGVHGCVIVTPAQSAQIIMKLLTLDESTPEHERQPVGFTPPMQTNE